MVTGFNCLNLFIYQKQNPYKQNADELSLLLLLDGPYYDYLLN